MADGLIEEAEALLTLVLTPGIGRVTVHALLDACQRTDRLLIEVLRQVATRNPIEPKGQFPEFYGLMAKWKPELQRRASYLIKKTLNCGAEVLPVRHPDYPARLRVELGKHAPLLLFCFGNRSLLGRKSVAVVGKTNPTTIGRKTVDRLCRILVEEKAVIISGGADGVDSMAHQATLKAGGSTVMVLPQGILRYGISEFYRPYLESGSLLILSEFAPDARWETYAAVTRNDTIAALSNMVCVVEPGRVQGSVRTAQRALGHRKPVLVFSTETDDGMAELLFRRGGIRMSSAFSADDVDILKQSWQTASDSNDAEPAERFLFDPNDSV